MGLSDVRARTMCACTLDAAQSRTWKLRPDRVAVTVPDFTKQKASVAFAETSQKKSSHSLIVEEIALLFSTKRRISLLKEEFS